jgi:hypothetical protein
MRVTYCRNCPSFCSFQLSAPWNRCRMIKLKAPKHDYFTEYCPSSWVFINEMLLCVHCIRICLGERISLKELGCSILSLCVQQVLRCAENSTKQQFLLQINTDFVYNLGNSAGLYSSVERTACFLLVFIPVRWRVCKSGWWETRTCKIIIHTHTHTHKLPHVDMQK